MKQTIQIIAGATSLIALLVYTFVHTGGLLSRYITPAAVGYVAAFGIELAIVSLSLRIGDLKRSKQNYGFFLFVLLSVVIVSALANIAEGFQTANGSPLSLENFQSLDIVQSIIGLAATGLISLIVLALSEIIGTDVETAVQQSKRVQRKLEKESKKQSNYPKMDYFLENGQSNESPTVQWAELGTVQRMELSDGRKEEMLGLLLENSNISPKAVQRKLDIGKSTYYNYLNELIAEGRIKKNGNGIEVLGG